MSYLHALPSFLVHLCVLLRIVSYRFVVSTQHLNLDSEYERMVIHSGPLSSWGYGLAPFRLGIWIGPFPVGDMDRPLSGSGYGLAPSGWGYGPTHF